MLQVQELVDLPTRRTGLSAAIGELQLDSGLSEFVTCILVCIVAMCKAGPVPTLTK